MKEVLIVDDDSDIRDVITLLLRSRFRIIGSASTSEEAINLAQALNPDVVILDYVMPHMDGSQIAAIIRESNEETKIIAFSAIAEPFMRRNTEWADGYLPKDRVSELPGLVERIAAAS